MATVLLTGARGYLGSAVAAELAARGIAWAPLAGRLQAVQPVSLDAPVVIHCAGALRHQPQRWLADNVAATQHLLAGLRVPARLVFASSRSVYGAAPGQRCSEDIPPAPLDGYGASKFAAEQALCGSGHAVLCCRLPTLFGAAPAGDCPSLPNAVLRRWLAGETVHLVPQDIEVDYLAVGDAARLLVALALRPAWPADAINLPGPARGLHTLMRAMAGAAAAQGLPAGLAFDHPAAAAWPLLDGKRLRAWLPEYRPSDDAEVAATWLQRARAAAGPC